MMHCIIVDDEQLVRELLEDNISKILFLHLVKTCKNPLEAIEILQTEQIDLIFLDIQMPRLNGLQFLQTLNRPPLVILVTAYEKYALEGFELNVVDYVLKPFSFERFLKACNRANDLFKLQQSNKTIVPAMPEDFFVNVEYTLVKIVVADIDYIEGLKDYIKIHLSSSTKPVLTRMTIKAIEEKLPPPAFIRTHKSFLAAANKITTVKRDFVYIGQKEVPVSESYKENITRILNRLEH
ncbi:two component transcriptional regulator, LytTR family [Mucilaginibacter lappiensis]|uniref:DNA-binding LytR/AlgR family response regulator n=1 Tax=Mucilaginibacter lappiensis TaxID=354630 RepID=A0ABR6PRJ6_9SPHI|nr:LytTR family DNA-binding domain-containing protein [Mucilaginibacter lappiensis]MBB6112407.1 DNA-binding LytR/AlgR family response regulator [Mucilaginibacter lappiensis]SIS00812.1 two component transcriptional regulator, LytTR family [Mucilaginibacter lappiensis]